jgi:hypothetical protein
MALHPIVERLRLCHGVAARALSGEEMPYDANIVALSSEANPRLRGS